MPQAEVTKVGPDQYAVKNFSVRTDLAFEVAFKGDEAVVVIRSGTTCTAWDREAIQAVQKSVLFKTYKH